VKFSRTVLLLAAATACVAMLSACGNSSKPTNVTPALDTTPPPAPENLAVATTSGTNRLSWTASTDPDVVAYQVYQYMPDPTRDNSYVMIGESVDNEYMLDRNPEPVDTFFKVRCVDRVGNLSSFSPAFAAHLPAIFIGGGAPNNPPDGDPHYKLNE
jgi:hypothetical protein